MPPECHKYLYVERHIISCRLLDHSPLKVQVFPPGLHNQIQWMHAFKTWIEKKLDIVVLCSARLSMRKCCIAWESRLQGQDLDAAEMRGPDTRYLCCSASGQPQVLLSAATCAMWLIGCAKKPASHRTWQEVRVGRSRDVLCQVLLVKVGNAQWAKSGLFVQWVYWVYLFRQNTRPQCNAVMYEQV